MPWLDIACVVVQAVFRLAVCGLPALPPPDGVEWRTVVEASPFIVPEPLRQAPGSVVRGNIPHNLAEVLQFNWLTQ
eukprot:3816798-Pleurochrysis_carterae.AAC.1